MPVHKTIRKKSYKTTASFSEAEGVAHNTDESGAVYLFAPPDSKTRVRVSPNDLGTEMGEHLKNTTEWEFDQSESNDDEPVFPISISQELIDIFHKGKSTKRNSYYD